MIPDDILSGLRDYAAGGHNYPFGGFLTAVLANDLVEAAARADVHNRGILHAYARFLRNEMPGRIGDPTVDLWGSYDAVDNHTRAYHDEGMK